MYEGKLKYHGDEATLYEAKRTARLDWDRENEIIDRLFGQMPAGSKILDVPCGTGRLFPLADAHGHKVLGADISPEMFGQVDSSRLRLTGVQGLVGCDAERLPFADNSFDYVVSLRFFHFELPVETARAILREYSRVARKAIVLHLVVRNHMVLGRVADLLENVIYYRSQAPAQIAKRIKPYLLAAAGRLKGMPADKKQSDSGSNDRLPWTMGELEKSVDECGLAITQNHGAVSRFSAKRICMLEPKEQTSVSQ